MAHRTARLNEYGRLLLATPVIVEGWTVPTAARADGATGLADRSSRPLHSPRSTRSVEVELILAARRELRWGPDRLGPLVGHPVSPVAAVLRRTGAPRLADLDRPTGILARRYEVCHPVCSSIRTTRGLAGSQTAAAATESSAARPSRGSGAGRGMTSSR